MNRKISTVFLMAAILSPFIVISQDTTLKQLSPFTSIDISKRGKVIVTQGDSHSFRTDPADKAGKVNATVTDNTLSIDAPSGVTVYVTMKEIGELSVSGFGSIASESPIKSENLRLAISGSGKIQIKDADVKKLSTDISGIGKVTVSGKAETTDINISGSGKVDAAGLKTSDCDTKISGIGKCIVDVTDNLNVSISGSGSVNYVNPPKNISKNISGIGKVKELQDSSDTTSLRLGNKTITISGNSDATTNNNDEETNDDNDHDNNRDNYSDWGHGWEKWGEKWGDKSFFDEKKKKKKSSERNKPSWPGIELGVNGYMDVNNSTTLPQGLNYLDLDYGKSISFSINFFEAHKSFFSRHLFINTGLGVTWNNYRFSNNITLVPTSTTVLANFDSISYEKDKLTASYLIAPAMAEVFFGHNRYKSFHVAGGMLLGYKLGSHTKQKYESDGRTIKTKVYDDFNLSPFRASVRVSIGYGSVSIFAEQALTTLFQKDKGPLLYPFTAGIKVSFF